MEVRSNRSPETVRTSQSARASIPDQRNQEEKHTSDGSQTYRLLFGGEPNREHMLVTALAHAAEEHEAVEQAMRLSEVRYRRLFEASKDSIIIVDADQLTVLDANPAAERLFDMSRQCARGRLVTELTPFAQTEGIEVFVRTLMSQESTHQEITVHSGSDTPQHLDVVASLYAEQGKGIVQLSIRDITDRKKTDRLEAKTADLIAERQQLIDVNYAKDEFISVASHQLRTPATAVKQYLGLLLQGFVGHLTRDQRHTLQRAYDSNERQLKIINDLLLVARVDAGKVVLYKEPTDLTRQIRDIVAEQQSVLERRKQPLELHVPRTLKTTVDPRFLRMVIENLLSNASKYSPDGHPITIAGRRDRKHVYITITDKGFGISKADQSKLYHKFSRIYNEHATSVEGTGLGLYWSKKIIELHNGTLELESQIDEGSTFTITLPAR